MCRAWMGETPLITASRWGSFRVVQVLLRWNADVYARDILGNSAYMVARNSNVLRYLYGPSERETIFHIAHRDAMESIRSVNQQANQLIERFDRRTFNIRHDVIRIIPERTNLLPSFNISMGRFSDVTAFFERTGSQFNRFSEVVAFFESVRNNLRNHARNSNSQGEFLQNLRIESPSRNLHRCPVCIVCLEEMACWTFVTIRIFKMFFDSYEIPCGHPVLCQDCRNLFRNSRCPICRAKGKLFRIYM